VKALAFQQFFPPSSSNLANRMTEFWQDCQNGRLKSDWRGSGILEIGWSHPGFFRLGEKIRERRLSSPKMNAQPSSQSPIQHPINDDS